MYVLTAKREIGNKRLRIRLVLASMLFSVTCLVASSISIQVAMAAGPERAARFAGTWQGKFEGKVFVTVTLATEDGKISGKVSRVTFEMDASGNLTNASAIDGEDEIAETAPEGDVLHLTTKAKGKVETAGGDSDESIQYDMTLTGENEGELQVAGAPPGMPGSKPWKLERTPTQE